MVVIAAGVFWGTRSPQPPPFDDHLVVGSGAETTIPSTLTVHVAGWVAAPGLYELVAGARVADAVAAAGGLLPGADTSGVNLAAVLVDGEQVVIPGPGPPGGTPVAPGAGGTEDGIVHLNRATVAELETLPGVGPVLAERIVEYRDQHGPFTAVEDLLDVPGIGEAKLAALRDRVAVP